MSGENAKHWQLAGIQHAVFMRIFPSLRHALVGPVSIARMSTSIVKRLVDKDGQPGINEQIARIDQQLQEAVLTIRALQSWEPASGELASPVALLQQGLQLMTTTFAMHQVNISLAEDWAASLSPEPVVQSAFLYAWLGVLCHCQDRLEGQALLQIEAIQPTALSTRLPSSACRDVHLGEHAGLAIDREAVGLLARHAGWAMELDDTQISLDWQAS